MSGGLENNIDNVVPTAGEKEAAPEAVNLAGPKPEASQPSASGFIRDLLTWEGSSFDFVEKGFSWYAIAGLIILGIIGYFVWSQDWFSIGITVVVSMVLFWYVATARPKNQSYAITQLGINIDGREFPFAEMHSFGMVYNQKVKKLYITLAKKYLPVLSLDLTAADPTKVRAILSRKLPEEASQGENILDRMLRALKI